jgi:hypothetical protein
LPLAAVGMNHASTAVSSVAAAPICFPSAFSCSTAGTVAINCLLFKFELFISNVYH